MLLSVYGGTVCRQRHLSLLSRHCRQRRSEAGATENGPQYDLCADCRQLHALLRGAAAPAQGNTILPDPLGRGPGGGAGEDAVDQRTTDAVHGSISHHGMACGVCGKGLHRSGPALPDAGGSGRDLLLGGSGVLRRQEAKHLCRVDLPRTVPPVDSGGVFLPLSGGISVCAENESSPAEYPPGCFWNLCNWNTGAVYCGLSSGIGRPCDSIKPYDSSRAFASFRDTAGAT